MINSYRLDLVILIFWTLYTALCIYTGNAFASACGGCLFAFKLNDLSNAERSE